LIKKSLMRIISLLLALSLCFCCCLTLLSCSTEPPEIPECTEHIDEDLDLLCDECGEKMPEKEPDKKPVGNNIVVPEYKDYGRDTVNFSELEYIRPSITSIVAELEAVTEAITANEKTFEEQLKLIEDMEEDYTNVLSAYTVSQICSYKNSSDTYWAEEYEYMTSNYPQFVSAIEDMMVAAAKSPHAELFEEQYFGEGLIEEYADGGIYTDEVVTLLEKEAELETQYTSLSTANVEIVYKGKTATYDEHMAEIELKYAPGSKEYIAAAESCAYYYQLKLQELGFEIYVELIKVRRSIADEMGLESYAEYGYEAMGHDYSEKEMMDFFDAVREYVFPTYTKLEGVFSNYFMTNQDFKLDRVTLINTMYEMYGKLDTDIFDIYKYMLQHGLYDVNVESSGRFDGAFTSYIESNNSPYLFMTTTEYGKDFLTLSHEFGHFIDGYVNYNAETSLDLSEVSSQAFELISLLSLKDYMSEESYLYLMYYELESTIITIIDQAFISAFEHYVYQIEYSQINEETIGKAAIDAFKLVTGIDIEKYNAKNLVIFHTIVYPFYVQSYATSLIPSLEIFIKEYNKAGSGLEIYKNLVSREDNTLSFEENLALAGLSSPFKALTFENLMSEFYAIAIGCENYVDSDLAGVA